MCCGRPSSNPHPSYPNRPAPMARGRQPPATSVAFEYTGPTSMTVRGAATGASYRFAGPGARVAVDPRDAPSLLAVPRLRRG